MDNRPIGMFDSGCGGLTVLKEYIKILPNEDYIYFGDTAHLPYGDKSPEKIIAYSEEIIKFLISKNVKLIIIACGTASAIAYENLKKKYDIEIRNIIEPTIQSINDENIGVIATKATIKSCAWENALRKSNPTSNITSVACSLFVPLIEEGFVSTPATDYVIEEYMKNFFSNGTCTISSLILGCTHYPILESKIQKALGSTVKLVNVGEYSAKDTAKFLENANMSNLKDHIGTQEFFSSDDFELFKENAKKIGFEIKK